MVEKVITSPHNVVDFARYQADRNATGKALAMSPWTCRHCGAALAEGESEDECSSTFNVETPRLRGGPRKFLAD
jgi:ribosomal protein L37AE/L43A